MPRPPSPARRTGGGAGRFWRHQAGHVGPSPHGGPAEAETTHDAALDERFFLDLLGRGFSEDDARVQLDTAIQWGRYGELFDYAADDRKLILTRPEDEARG
jgi:hypothetical protein